MTNRLTMGPKESAEALLEGLWNTDRYPVDPTAIAKGMSIVVELWNIPEDVSGMLKKDVGSPPTIYVNASDHPRRRRFTVAHELGHYVERSLRGERDARMAYVDRRGQLASLGTDPRERFANEFAANLLMPEAAVRSLAREGMSLPGLAGFFDVSIIAMENRLKNLGIWR